MKTSVKDFRQVVAQVGEIDEIMIDVEKAEGIYVWDTSGKQYMDMLSGICVGNVGHRNPKVVSAVKEQLDKYMHVMVYGEFVQSPQYRYIKRLKEFLPTSLSQIFYVNSGSEAIEGALKTAKLFTGRSEVISCNNSYHGSTLGAVSMLSQEIFTRGFRPLIPDCNKIRYNDFDDLEKISERTACLVIEPISVGAGVELPKEGYMEAVRKRCNETGTVLIFDEIQTGFGRTGKLFAFEHFKRVVPDILCIAKGMGGGMPIGAFIGREDIMQRLNNHHPLIGHASTFGGHPVSCAAALATLDCIVEDNLMDKVEGKGNRYRKELTHPLIKEVRGKGLFNCIELSEKVNWQTALKSCFKEGIITGTHLFDSQCLSLKPALIITDEQITESIARIKRALNRL